MRRVLMNRGSRHARDFLRRYGVAATNLVLWLDSNDPRSGVSAATWDDLSGNEISGQDNDMKQATAANQPTVVTTFPKNRTFDGTADFMTQEVFDTNQGAMTFIADGGTAEFRDAGQNFADWETTSGNATHMIVITTNNGISWAYMGASNNGGLDIDCYSDIALTTRGWKGRTTPQATPDTPASYKIYKTDFQITGAQTMLAWGKIASGAPKTGNRLISKYDTVNVAAQGMEIYRNGSGYASCQVPGENAAGSTILSDDTWYMIGGIYSPSGEGNYVKVVVDGVVVDTQTATVPAALDDVYLPLAIGCDYSSGVTSFFWNGNIAPAIVFSRALSAEEIKRIYDRDKGLFN